MKFMITSDIGQIARCIQSNLGYLPVQFQSYMKIAIYGYFFLYQAHLKGSSISSASSSQQAEFLRLRF
jgi:hypothetical protein